MNKSPSKFQSYNKVTKIFAKQCHSVNTFATDLFSLGSMKEHKVSISLKAPFIGFQIK